MERDALESLLKASMGLSAESIGSGAIARAVQERQEACNLADPQAYLERVRGSEAELQALIEAVVVPETWFFRDRHAFAALGRLGRDTWMPAHPEGMLCLLSLPCSTGEEPYSMAMALIDAGMPANRFRIDAVDISSVNVAQATRAVYGKNSFRGLELGFRDHHFDHTAEGYRVSNAVRQQVRFLQGNLFAADFLPGIGSYDVVFCRNVLIYFDRITQDRALSVLNRLLSATGVLFVAPAETALPASHGLVSTKEPLAFAFRRRSALPAKAKAKSVPPLKPLHRGVVPARPMLRVALTPATAAQTSASLHPAQAPAPSMDLDEAARLADQGHFVEAASRCEEHLRRSGPSATAFYLMGLVRDATGNHSEAASYYRKALYLDADHYETQIQLALLIEKQGDAAGALVLRNRARRLEEKGKK